MSSQEDPGVVGHVEVKDDAAAQSNGGSLGVLMDVSMPVVIEIGRTQLTVQQLLNLTPGSVVQLDRSVGEPVDIYVGGRRLASGEVVVVDDHFGVRITHVSPPNGEVSA